MYDFDGTRYKRKEYPEFERYDLEFAAYKLVKKQYTNSHSKALDILSKAQLFDDYQHITKTYDLDYNKGKFKEECIDFDIAPPHNSICTQGFYFSEIVLQEELGLEPDIAIELKEDIDHFYFPCAMSANGNVRLSDKMLIEEGIKRIEYEKKYTDIKATRIMTSYPFGMYCLCIDSDIVNKEGEKVNVPILRFDEIYPNFPKYFLNNEKYILNYAKNLFENFVGRFNIVFDHIFYKSLKKHFSVFLAYVNENFEIVEVEQSYFGRGFLITEPRKSNKVLHTSNKLKILPDLSSLGNIIKLYRIKKNLTQPELAAILGVDIKSIHNWESNKKKPRLDNFEQLKNVLGIPYL